jgi:hypothetical protein
MHIERWRLDVCLADHHMHLGAVMRLVVEEMKHSDRRCLHVILALVVSVGKLPLQKISIGLRKERFDFPVLCGARERSSAKSSNRIEFSGGVVCPLPANRDIQIRSPSST